MLVVVEEVQKYDFFSSSPKFPQTEICLWWWKRSRNQASAIPSRSGSRLRRSMPPRRPSGRLSSTSGLSSASSSRDAIHSRLLRSRLGQWLCRGVSSRRGCGSLTCERAMSPSHTLKKRSSSSITSTRYTLARMNPSHHCS